MTWPLTEKRVLDDFADLIALVHRVFAWFYCLVHRTPLVCSNYLMIPGTLYLKP